MAVNTKFQGEGGGGGGWEGEGSDEAWDRETMLSQLATRSIRGLVSGLSKAAVCFLTISTSALSVE